MTHHTASRRLRLIASLTVAGICAAACSGGDSVIDAGRDDDPIVTDATPPAGDVDETDQEEPPPIDAADDPESDSVESRSTESDDSESGEPVAAPSDSEPLVEESPLGDLPPCPVDALDAADGPVEITMWFGLADALGTELEALAAQYNAAQDRVVVEIDNQIDYESTIDSYLQLGVDQRPEVLLAPEFVVQTFAESGTFVPLEACAEAADYDTSMFLPRALNAYAYDAVQWALPFNVSSPVLYFVEPRFEAAGLDPADPPLTPDDLRQASEALVSSGAATYGVVVDVARDSAGGYFEQWFGHAGAPFVDNDNGRSGRATEVLFDNATGRAALEFLRSMRADGLSFNVGQNTGGLDSFLKLVDPTEPGAMTVSTSAALTQVLDALDGGLGGDLTRDDLGVGPLPGPTDSPAAQVGGASLWIPADKGDAATAAAWDFASFLLEAQTQSTWAAATGYVPVRTDAVELDPIATVFTDDPRFRVSYDQLAAPTDDSAAARPALGPQREVRQAVVDAIARIYDDPEGVDIDALLDETAVTANTLIRNYNDLN
ncbi:MAG: extracellular solute-binding protein [Ilumatobacter sp.]